MDGLWQTFGQNLIIRTYECEKNDNKSLNRDNKAKEREKEGKREEIFKWS